MSDARIFFLELLAFSRKSSRTPESILTSVVITAIVFSLTILILLVSPVFMTTELALLLIYGLAIYETLLGLRVGFLRIGLNSNEHFLSVPSRFWKRSFPYLFPSILIPIPISIAVANFLSTNLVSWWLIFVSIVFGYMMFYFLGVAWSIIVRLISKKTLPRLLILILFVAVFLGTLSSGDFVFRTILVSQNFSDYMHIFVIIAELSSIAFLVIIAELALGSLSINTNSIGSYWRLFTSAKSYGYGQGSSSFFAINKFFLRSTAFHRRASGLILSLLLFLLVLYATFFVGGSLINQNILLIALLIFTAVSSLLVSRTSAQLVFNKTEKYRHLPIDINKVVAGGWLSALAWQLGLALLFFGIIGTWIKLDTSTVALVVIGAATQHTLFFGWGKKLANAHHHNLALFAVFSMTVLVGILPILLLPLIGVLQTALIQLIWFGFIGILLQITNREGTVKYA